MLKKPIVLSLLLTISTAHAVPEWDQWDEKMWLVHASPIMLTNSTATAGALNLGSRELIVSDEDNIHHRMTFHNCLGSISPDSTMAVGGSLMGISMPSELDEGMAERNYIFMAPWRSFAGEIIGGGLLDTFTFANHTYGTDSVVFIPGNEREQFAESNPNYTGTTIFYDPATQQLRDLVTHTLRERDSWTLEYTGEEAGQSPDAKVRIDGEEVDIGTLQEQFKSRVTYVGHHNHSTFKLLEAVLEPFTRPFLAISSDRSLRNTFITNTHAEVLHVLAASLFAKIEDSLAPFTTDSHATFREWRTCVYEWLNLHEQIKRALLAGKDLSEITTLRKLPALRKDSTQLGEFLASLSETSRKVITHHYESISGMEMFIPEYLTDFERLSAQTFRDIWVDLEGGLSERLPWLLRIRTYLTLKRILEDHSKPTADTENYLALLGDTLDHLEGQPLGSTSSFDRLILESISNCPTGIDRLAHEASVFRTLSSPPLRRALSNIYSEPTFESGEELNFKELLPHSSLTSRLYNDKQATKASEHALFLRDKLLGAEVNSFNEASALAASFITYASELSQGTLGKPLTLATSPAMLGMMAFLGGNTNSQSLLAQEEPTPLTITAFKAGAFGTLDEILGFYGLEKELREKFPSDEDLWEHEGKITFPDLLQQLRSLKRSKGEDG